MVGVSVDTPDAEHMTALHLAVQRGLVEVITLLLEAGARVNNKMNDKVQIEAFWCLFLLYHSSQQMSQYWKSSTSVLWNDAESDFSVHFSSPQSSPLHIAASRGYSDIVRVLLERGAKVDSLDGSDRTALFLAVSRANYKVVQLLLQRSAKVNIEEIHGKLYI